MSEQEACLQFVPHPVRKFCGTCRRPREDHPLSEEDAESIKQNLKVFEDQPKAMPNAQYAWTPPGCPVNRLDEYFKKFSESEVPKHKSEGQQNRLKRLVCQIPLSDLSPENCRVEESEFKSDLEDYTQKLQTDFLRLGVVKEWSKGMAVQCRRCLYIFEPDELVTAISEESGQAYHPACFVCSQCQGALADLIYCSDVDGTVYCLRHHSDRNKKRCHACDELIFSTLFAVAGQQFYHRNHLLCFACDRPLEGTKSPEKGGELYCGPCYEERFCNDCSKCGERITVDSRHLAYKDKNWHYGCFTCCKCETPMADAPFEIVEEEFLCADCFDKKHAPKCGACGDKFPQDAKVVKYEDKIYHVSCFKCADCHDSIGTDSFVPDQGRIYCRGCHQRNFAVRCFRCSYAITDDGGIMYDKRPYHADCFTCYGCSTKVASGPFKTVNGKWYCMACYGDKFCKRCHSCGQPILLGTDEDILYSFQEYRWHASCFVCSVCKTSLDQKPFTIREKAMVCKGCLSQERTSDDINQATTQAAEEEDAPESVTG